MHKARGWSGIGYHYVIRRDGRVENGRPVDQIGAHVSGHNGHSVGVAMVGGVDAKGRPENNMTDAQFVALEKLLRTLAARYPNASVCGHRDLSPDKDGDGVIEPHEYLKACPCFDAIPWAKSKGLPAARIRGTWRDIGTVDPIKPAPQKPADALPPVPAPSPVKAPDARPVQPVPESGGLWSAIARIIRMIVKGTWK